MMNQGGAARWKLGVLALIVALGGCSGMRETLGVGKSPPDEFAVVKSRPLVVPPDYDLRPPRPDEKRAKDLESSAQAISALFPGRTSLPAPSKGEQALLKAAGADDADRDVRSTLNDEASLIADKGAFLRDLLATDAGVVEADGTKIEHVTSQPLP